jgi:release factor glutamine methyltransferase
VSTEQSWTIKGLLEWTASFLQRKGVESPRLETELLLAHALGCTRMQLYTRYDEEPPEGERKKFKELVQQRTKGKPVAHLLGRKEFFSLEFEVGPAVLVPRPDSEWLVTECLRLAKGMPEPLVLDVGTGSGCLAVAVAHRHKKAQVTAVDVSAEALTVARRNAERHKVAERITFLQGDLFAPVPAEGQFDFIVSNPPYIPSAEIATLAPDVRDHEPRLALDGGADGFAVFDRLVGGAANYLKPGGYLLVEIHAGLEDVSRERIDRGGYELGKTILDLAGRPRVLCARRALTAQPPLGTGTPQPAPATPGAGA